MAARSSRAIRDRSSAAIEVSIEDEGPLTAEISERVFEPFFTTKSFGTGLGLTIVKRTVEAHGGNAHLEPRASGGAVATLVLPLTPETHHGAQVRSPS